MQELLAGRCVVGRGPGCSLRLKLRSLHLICHCLPGCLGRPHTQPHLVSSWTLHCLQHVSVRAASFTAEQKPTRL